MVIGCRGIMSRMDHDDRDQKFIPTGARLGILQQLLELHIATELARELQMRGYPPEDLKTVPAAVSEALRLALADAWNYGYEAAVHTDQHRADTKPDYPLPGDDDP